jgi:hypothetical protein
MSRGTHRLRRAAVALAAAVAVALAGCGGSGKPAYCADRDALQSSLTELKNVNVGAEGIEEVKAKLTKVESDAQALVASARKEFGPQASALESSVSKLKTSAQSAAAAPSAQSFAAVAGAASGVASTFGELSSAVSSKCK